MKKILYAIMLLSVAMPLMAQIQGRVTCANDDSSITGVIVIAKRGAERKLLGYARTDNEGKFQLKIEPKKGIWVHLVYAWICKR